MLEAIQSRVLTFEIAAHKLLGMHEGATSRIVNAKKSLDRVSALSIKQEDMLQQAVRCVEVQVFRAAHVLAFAAFIDYLHELAARDEFVALNTAMANWKISSVDDLRDKHTDYGFIEALEKAGTITRSERKAFHSLLTRRNESAHPSNYYPDMNQSLGYLSEIISRIEAVKSRNP